MANAKATNVRQKLAQARLAFLNENVKKSGKNMHLEFKYFELEDIVPSAIKIFADLGLVTTTNFDGTTATMTVYNADSADEEGITFTAPYREVEQIVSNSGKVVTNAMQALGSSITYLRRYLYMMVLDIVEHDEVDANIGANPPAEEKSAAMQNKPPATPKERAKAKEKLTAADGDATEEQINSLKTLCKELINTDDSTEDFVQQIALKTEGFTKISASACAELISNLTDMIASYGG